MHQAFLMIVCLLSLCGLVGCQTPAAPLALTDERPVAVRLQVGGGFHVQAMVGAYTQASIDHVRLRLLMKDAAGVYQPTGVASGAIAQAALASPVSLGNLKIGKSYRVQADAYADAAETTLISDTATSLTDFTTPSVVTTAGVANINDATLSLALTLKLAKREYAGTATFTVNVTKSQQNKLTSLKLTVYEVDASLNPVNGVGGNTWRFQKTVAYDDAVAATPSFTVTNLRYGARYVILAEGFQNTSKKTNDSNSNVNFSVPGLVNGQQNDDVNALVGAITVPCR